MAKKSMPVGGAIGPRSAKRSDSVIHSVQFNELQSEISYLMQSIYSKFGHEFFIYNVFSVRFVSLVI